MKKLLIIAGFVLLTGCAPEVKLESEEDITAALNDSDMRTYIEKVSYELGEKVDGEIPITIQVEASDELSENEDLNIFIKLEDAAERVIDDEPYPECGFYDCVYDKMEVKSDDTTYLFEGLNNEWYALRDKATLSKNNSEPKGYWDMRTKVTKTAPASSSSPSSPTDEEVYEYMKSQYDQITNYGANYVPEIHDDQVAELASQKFGISASEAGQIYIDMEMSQY